MLGRIRPLHDPRRDQVASWWNSGSYIKPLVLACFRCLKRRAVWSLIYKQILFILLLTMERPVIWENEERIPSPSEKLIQKSKEMPYVPIGKFVNKYCVKCSAIAIRLKSSFLGLQNSPGTRGRCIMVIYLMSLYLSSLNRHCWYPGHIGVWCLCIPVPWSHEYITIPHETKSCRARNGCGIDDYWSVIRFKLEKVNVLCVVMPVLCSDSVYMFLYIEHIFLFI